MCRNSKFDEDTAELKRMYVQTEYRKYKIGMKLLDRIVEIAKSSTTKASGWIPYQLCQMHKDFIVRSAFLKYRRTALIQSTGPFLWKRN